jgi:hypothetical protein
MNNNTLKALAVSLVVGSTVVAQAASFSGSISFNPTLTMNPNGSNLGNVQSVTTSAGLGNVSSGPSGIYAAHALVFNSTPVPSAFGANLPGGTLSFLPSATPQSFEVYNFQWSGSGTLYRYSLVSSGWFVVNQSVNFLNVFGTGTAYIKQETFAGSGVWVDAFDPSAAIWTLTGTETGGTPAWGLSTTATGAIPDGGTTLMLLGLGLSGLGLIRNKLS